MTREEKAIIYFKDMRKRLCEDYLNICPKNSIAYKATLAEKDFYDTAIKALEQDEYIKVPKKALKYRTAGMVAYNVEWLKNHFDIERAVICGAQEHHEDSIVEWKNDFNEYVNSLSISRDDYNGIMEYIDELPVTPAEKLSKWIPVNQPPKASGRYLVSMRYVTHDVVETANYATDLHRVDKYDFPKHEAGWYNYDSEYGYYKIENVIVAYMPLPEPYKASPTGEEGGMNEIYK